MGKRILMSILVVAVAFGTVAAGTYAMWQDTVTSTGNTFSSGSLALLVNDQADPGVLVTMADFAPATSQSTGNITLKNAGTVDGTVSFTGTFTDQGAGSLSQVLEVTEVTVDGVAVPVDPGTTLADLSGEAAGPIELEAGETKTVRVTVTMPSGVTGNMNESTSGVLNFVLDQKTP
jgi:predicted ribosomally synthesized peptide with SipW-like signal peptide